MEGLRECRACAASGCAGRRSRASAALPQNAIPFRTESVGAGDQGDVGVIRVLIVAAYASVRAGLHALLADEAECAVVGAVSGSDELARILVDCPPDVVLFDDNEGDGARVLEVLSGSGTGLVLLGDQRGGYQRLVGRA